MTSKYADLVARAKEWESTIFNPSEGGKILSEPIVALEELETGITETLAVVSRDIGDYTSGEAYERGWHDRQRTLSQPTTDTNGAHE